MAQKHWVLWPSAETGGYEEDGLKIHVIMAHDLLYFGSREPTDFWWLRNIEGADSQKWSDDDFEYIRNTLCELMDGEAHYAFDWWIWFTHFACPDIGPSCVRYSYRVISLFQIPREQLRSLSTYCVIMRETKLNCEFIPSETMLTLDDSWIQTLFSLGLEC